METFLARGKSFPLTRTYVMGILNITPDSFSDGGRYLDPAAALARGFLDALCRMALDQCRVLNPERLPVVLSGGVFLNQYLLHGVTRLLEADGFPVYTHRRVSPSDEGLALGQLAIGAALTLAQRGQHARTAEPDAPV